MLEKTVWKGALFVKCYPRRVLIAFVISVLCGTLLHFVYDFFPSAVTAIFSPVSESLWEHLKLIFWPYLVALLILVPMEKGGGFAPWLFSLLVISSALLGIAYCYHVLWGGESLFFDVTLYVLLMAAGFLLPRLLHPLAGKTALTLLLWLLVIALGFVLLVFTWYPPRGPLFSDLSAVRTWLTIPW